MTAFTDYLTDHAEQLDLGTLAITRAHGTHHPEVFEIRKRYETIRDRVALADGAQPQIGDELTRIRSLTNGYTIPDDACSTLAATYRMLEEAHRMYESTDARRVQ